MPTEGIQRCTDIPDALVWLQLLFDTQGGVRRLCGGKGEPERETSERLAAKSSPGRISGMEGSLTGGLEAGIHHPVGSIAPTGAIFHPVIFLVTRLSAWAPLSIWRTRRAAWLIISSLPVSPSASPTRGILWLRAVMPCRGSPVSSTLSEALLELELLRSVLDAVCIQGTERVSGAASQGTRSE